MGSRHSGLAVLLAAALAAGGCADTMKSVTDTMNAVIQGGNPANNLVDNGSFEQPTVGKGQYVTFNTGQSFPGWQVVGAPGSVSPISGDYAQNGIRFNAEQGQQWLDLTGPGSNSATGVQQSVRTQPGATYELVFYVGNVSGGAFGTSSSIEVLVDGKSLGIARNDMVIKGQQAWKRATMTFTATAAATNIAFINRDPPTDNSNGLDNVSVTLTGAATAPAPALTESFESPATANYTVYRAGQTFTSGANTWRVDSGTIDLVNVTARKETVAWDGNQTIDLAGSPGPGVLSTTFPTTAGQRYTLIFHYARNNAIGNKAAEARVEVLGKGPLLQATLRHAAPMPYSQNMGYSGSFVADGDVTTLRFTSLTGGNAGLTVDGVAVEPAPGASTPNLSGEYVYLGKGVATISQSGNEIHVFATWTPLGKGPHYEIKGTLAGDTITGQWYSLYAKKGWYRFVGKVLPNGDIECSQSEDPINANIRATVFQRKTP